MTPKLFTESNRAEEIKKHLPVNINFNFKNIAPAMAMAEQKFLVPILGKELFEKIVDDYNNNTTNETEKQAVEYAQHVVAKLAYFSAFDEISVMLDDKGASAPTENRLYKYQEDNLKKSLKDSAFDTLDELLQLLEDHKETYTQWDNSPWNKRMQKLLVRSTAEYNSMYYINNSHLIFMKMTYYMEIIETTLLPHRIGTEFLKKLKEEPDKEAYKPFIENLKKYVVYKSVAIGVEEMGKLPTERGLIWETISMTITNPKVEQRAETEKTKTTYDKYAEAYISEVIRYLNEHCEEYPEYMEYTNGKNAVTNRYKRDNRNKKILMV